jgi:hypothetical protein
MFPVTDPVHACAQAISLFFRTLGGWLRAPLRRGQGLVGTLASVLAALAIYLFRSARTHNRKPAPIGG